MKAALRGERTGMDEVIQRGRPCAAMLDRVIG